MRITFRCHENSNTVGTPDEAKPCKCGDSRLVVDGTCLFCGRFPMSTIRATWAKRAADLARGKELPPAVDVELPPLHLRAVFADLARL